MSFAKKIFSFVVVIILLLTIPSYASFAMPTKDLKQEQGGQVGYSVKKMSRDNTDATYFDLYVKPKDKKEMKARIYNETNEDMLIQMEIFTASTSSKAQVVYTQKSPKNDESMQYYMEDLVKLDAKNNTVKVPANGSTDVVATATIPSEISGVLLGSWYFEKKEDEDSEGKEGVNIKNRYSYAMAIKLEASQISNPNVNLLKVYPGLDNFHRAIIARVQNDRPALMTGVTITTEVKEKKSGKVLFESKEDNLKIAPNTTFDYPTFMDGELLKSGKYIFKMNVKTKASKLSKTEWDLKKEFTITDKEEAKLNKEAINEENSKTSIWFIIGMIALSVVILGLVAFLIFKKKKSKEKPKRSRKE